MSRAIHKLTVRRVEALSREGWHGDGGGLYLRIREDGSKRWILVWRRGTKRNEMFLGTHDDFRLGEIRDLAKAARQLIRQGFDPRELRKEAQRLVTGDFKPEPIHVAKWDSASEPNREEKGPEVSKAPLFGKFAEEYIASQEDGWKNEKHRWQWHNSISNHCAAIVDKPVDLITTEDVLLVLKPIWLGIQDTAARVRGRIERILNAAKAGKHIASPWENPAKWEGNLEHRLPKQKKRRSRHYAAINYEELPNFYKALERATGTGRTCSGADNPLRYTHQRDPWHALARDRLRAGDLDNTWRAYEDGNGASDSLIDSRAHTAARTLRRRKTHTPGLCLSRRPHSP